MNKEILIKLINRHFNEENWKFERIRGGRFSDTYFVSSHDAEYVLRIAPPDTVLQLFYEYRMMRQEPRIHKILLEHTDVPLPEIIAYDFSRELIDCDYLVMERLSGTPLNEARLDGEAMNRALFEWGSHVRSIHSIKDEHNRFGYLGEHHCMEAQKTWSEAFSVMFRMELEDIQREKVYDKKTVDFAYGLLQDTISVFKNRTESRLCHGDLWVTNLLVKNDGSVTGLIDFDRACWGDVEWDLAIAEYCGITRPSFWEGYGEKIETHSREAAVRRMFYLLYEHQKYIIISLSSRRNDPVGARRYALESLNVMRQFESTGEPLF